MRKCILTMVVVFLVSVGMNAQAILDSNGNATMYDGLAQAVDAAVDGDVIYLSETTYKACDIKKRISIKGSGVNTIIQGDVTISVSGSLRKNQPVMEGLRVDGLIRVDKNIYDMVFRKVQCNAMQLDASLSGGEIDRCYITDSLCLPLQGKDFYVRNSKIYCLTALRGSSGEATFVNCNIYKTNFKYIRSSFINCLLCNGNVESDYPVFVSSMSQNLSISKNIVIKHNWYHKNDDDPELLDTSCESPLLNSYKQNDRTVNGCDDTEIGIYGGVNPYDASLIPSNLPVAESCDLNVDNANGVMTFKSVGVSSVNK